MLTGINHLKTQPIQALKTNNLKYRGARNTTSQSTNGLQSGLPKPAHSILSVLSQHIASVSSRHKLLCRQNCKDKH